MEHRCGNRRQLNVAVTIHTRGGLVGQGYLREASSSGARLDTALPLAIHSIVDLVLPLAQKGSAEARPALHAEVVRHTDAGFGVAWTEFAPKELPTLYEQDTSARSPRKVTASNPATKPALRRR